MFLPPNLPTRSLAVLLHRLPSFPRSRFRFPVSDVHNKDRNCAKSRSFLRPVMGRLAGWVPWWLCNVSSTVHNEEMRPCMMEDLRSPRQTSAHGCRRPGSMGRLPTPVKIICPLDTLSSVCSNLRPDGPASRLHSPRRTMEVGPPYAARNPITLWWPLSPVPTALLSSTP